MAEFLFSNQIQIFGVFGILFAIAILISPTNGRNIKPIFDENNVSKENNSNIDGKIGIIIPLFTNYSDSGDWQSVINAKKTHPDVQMIAIVNPSSGSGSSVNPRIAEGVKKLHDVGVKVVGYVPTGYSWRSRDEVIAEIENYNNWYSIDGIFFDEVAHWFGREVYYIDLVGYMKSQRPESIVIGNPGTDEAMSTYTDIFDILVIYESQGLPASSKLDRYNKNIEKLAILAFGVNSLNETDLKSIANSIGWVFVTQEKMPNPWREMPAYFEDFVAMVENIGANESNDFSHLTNLTP